MDEIPGVGPRRKKALIQRFGSVQGIRDAALEEVAAVVGMTRSLAEKVKQAI
jgi:excinuclease ABC subunit C